MTKKSTNPDNSIAFNHSIEKLLNIMKKLRDKEAGCPWDQVQSFESIASYTIEEAYEVNDAIINKNWENLKEELGDLLLQVVYHSEIADEQKLFNFDEVVEGISKKMVNRHPHVFKNESNNSQIEQQIPDWEDIKQAEKIKKGEASVYLLDDVTKYLPALSRAEKIQKKAAMANFDWKHTEDIFDKLAEETEELLVAIANKDKLNTEEEIGDILFTIVNLARKLDVDPEEALRRTNQKFQKRINGMEDDLRKHSKKLNTQTIEELEHLWQVQKNKN
ncbi:MAG: nucleoside triphosphate pyrophosphohydrolase [Paracoccaceae bacterium]|nr:nucleoside triphosphate pyrophosphohydrolase [Paracoccaceae bacterium]